MKKFRVCIWHSDSYDTNSVAFFLKGAEQSPAIDIAKSHALRHTLEVEGEDSFAACSKALDKALASYPPLPKTEPDHIIGTEWNEDRRTDAGDLFIVFDLQSNVCEGKFLYCGERDDGSFVKIQTLNASISGHSVH